VVDEDGSASLLQGLDLFVQSLLFGDDGSQSVGHSLELLLICIIKVFHTLYEHLVHHVIVAGVVGGCLMYHGDDFTQEGEFFVL